jgi:cytochrome P450
VSFEHDLHRRRRAALNPFFSRRAVLKLEPVIHSLIEKLGRRIETYRGTERPLNLGDAYTAFTVDVVTEYSFANSAGSLDDECFGSDWNHSLFQSLQLTHVNVHLPWVTPLLRATPKWIMRVTNPALLASFVEFRKVSL